MEINKVTVIGSGVMGSGIAAHLVNGGFKEVFLLDILPRELSKEQIANGYTLDNPNIRNIISRKNLNNLIKSKPAQLGSKKLLTNITIGNTEDHFEKYISASDWIIEVVPEIIKIKNNTFKQIDQFRKPDSIVTSNTSGISIKEMTEGCSESLKKHFLITHFFNPVRYMKLLEIVKSDSIDQNVFQQVISIGEERLGKGIVKSYDVPAFVGNRIGVYNIMFLMGLVGEYSIEEINSVFDKKFGYGGKPFSTCDLVGLDTLSHVINYIYENTDDESHDTFKLPDYLKTMVENGNLGRKSGAGFFKRQKIKGKNVDFVFNPQTSNYELRKNSSIKSVSEAKRKHKISEAIQHLYNANDTGGEIYRKTINAVISYSFARAPQISPDGIEGIDKAIKWGFNQKYGPGEILDIIGVKKVITNLEKQGDIPTLLKDLYESGKESVYIENQESVFETKNKYRKVNLPDKYLTFHKIARNHKPIFVIKNGGQLYELEGNIFALEMLSKNGTINLQVIEAINQALKTAQDKGKGLIIGNDLDNFSFGADLNMMAGFILRSKTKKISEVIEKFQMLNYNLKFSKIPVVVIKKGMALGGGCELGYGAHIRAAHDTFIGLVEIGVGLIPGGAGVKETLVRNYLKHSAKNNYKPIDYIRETFEQIAYVKIATSAHEAKELGYLSETDGISMNNDFLLYDAIQDIKRLSQNYQPPQEIKVLLPGRDILATLHTGIELGVYAKQVPPMKVPGFIRNHFALVLKTFSEIVSGGELLPPGREFSEKEILALERKAFLRLTTGMSLKEKFSWLMIASSTLKKKPFIWAFQSINNSFFTKL